MGGDVAEALDEVGVPLEPDIDGGAEDCCCCCCCPQSVQPKGCDVALAGTALLCAAPLPGAVSAATPDPAADPGEVPALVNGCHATPVEKRFTAVANASLSWCAMSVSPPVGPAALLAASPREGHEGPGTEADPGADPELASSTRVGGIRKVTEFDLALAGLSTSSLRCIAVAAAAAAAPPSIPAPEGAPCGCGEVRREFAAEVRPRFSS